MSKLCVLFCAVVICGCSSTALAESKRDAALKNLRKLTSAMVVYRTVHEKYPDTLDALLTLKGTISKTDLTDPWKTKPKVVVFTAKEAEANGISFELISAGPDRKFGTADDISYPPRNPDFDLTLPGK